MNVRFFVEQIHRKAGKSQDQIHNGNAVLYLACDRGACNAHQGNNEHKKIRTPHHLFRRDKTVVLFYESRQVLLAHRATEEEDKQKYESGNHSVAEGGERDGHDLVLNQSNQKHRYAVAKGQILDTAFFGKAVDDKEGLKADHQTAAEYL